MVSGSILDVAYIDNYMPRQWEKFSDLHENVVSINYL